LVKREKETEEKKGDTYKYMSPKKEKK